MPSPQPATGQPLHELTGEVRRRPDIDRLSTADRAGRYRKRVVGIGMIRHRLG